jgi:paraquat-inducible protein B
MLETFPERSTAMTPIIRQRRRLSPVWIVPIVAALLGLWLVWQYYSARGPEITVRFENAEGIVPGKTPVVCRSVNIGNVEGVQLSDDLKGVIVRMRMSAEATRLLTQDAQIWVVRPRYGGSGISGLSTIVSGNYIELEPGVGPGGHREFTGLEQPPVTPKGVPGLRIRLTTSEAGGIGPGSPILYKGLGAGKVETRVFHPEGGTVEFTAFIAKEYAGLVRENTKFWNVSGIDVQVNANGFQLQTGSLESILLGGITFNEPVGKSPAVADGATFPLYASQSDTKKFTMMNSVRYLLLFTGSVRGLAADAPVEFRGIRIGTVEGVSFNYLPNNPERRVPVAIQIDPSRIADLPDGGAEAFIADSVRDGLRASLKTGNLLTGGLFVDLDFQKDPPPAAVTEMFGYNVMPTVSGGLGELQDKATAVLDKLAALPLEDTLKGASDALAAVKTTVANLDKTMSGFNRGSPLYEQLEATLRSVQTLADTLERKPNSLIFGKGKSQPTPTPTPEPRTRSRR